jgi:hypothetical protein
MRERVLKVLPCYGGRSSQLVLQALSNTNSNMFKIVGMERPHTPNGVCHHSTVSS